MADINTDSLNGTVNNSFGIAEGVTGGVQTKSNDIGVALGTWIQIGLYVAIIAVVLGVVILILNKMHAMRRAGAGKTA